jgi:hypothetical protein
MIGQGREIFLTERVRKYSEAMTQGKVEPSEPNGREKKNKNKKN